MASKDDLNFLEKRVETLEYTTSEHTKEIDKINEKLKALEQDLLNKVNCDQFDQLMAIVNQLQASGNNKGEPVPVAPIISSKELNKLKDLSDKLAEMETRLDTLSK